MLKSLYLYSKYFGNSFLHRRERELLIHDFKKYQNTDFLHLEAAAEQEKEKAIHDAASWLLRAQQMMDDDGFGSFHLVNGWTNSYPETSGYIIPSLMRYADIYHNEEIKSRLVSSADWLLSIQFGNGGWQGGRIGEGKPPIVFNTAQIIRGMLSVYHYTKAQQYLDAAVKAADWLCDIQEPNGCWQTHALMSRQRVYDAYVDAPLAEMWKLTGNDSYRKAALRNLDWIILEKQQDNGWFQDCDNTIKRNNKPILHTIAYTIDGLLDCASLFGKDLYMKSAKTAADALLDKFTRKGYLNGRYDENWNGSEDILCTGSAQMAINWFKLEKLTGNEKYATAAIRMTDLLIHIQNRGRFDTENTRGALQGSFPIWGRYEPFAFPNWATKYLLDALLLEKEIQK